MIFPEWMKRLGKVYRKHGRAIFIDMPLPGVVKAMESIKDRGIHAMSGISGYDSGNGMLLFYHFVHAGVVLTLRVRLPEGRPLAPSVAGIFPSAMLFEQENHEMLGIAFKGNKSMGPVLLSGDSPRTPLKKKGERNAKGE